jgi:hypothetical protein
MTVEAPEFRFNDTKKITAPDFLSKSGGHEVDLRDAKLDFLPGVYNEEGGYLEPAEDATGMLVGIPLELEQDKDYTLRLDWGYSVLPQWDVSLTTVKPDMVWANRAYSDLGLLSRHPIGRNVDYVRFGNGVTDETQWDFAFDEGDSRLVLDMGVARVYSITIFEGDNTEVFKANGVTVGSDGRRVSFPTGLVVGESGLANLVPVDNQAYERYATAGPSGLMTPYDNQLSTDQMSKYTDGTAALPSWLASPSYPGAALQIVEPGIYTVTVGVYYGNAGLDDRLLEGRFQVHNSRKNAFAVGRSGSFTFVFDNVLVFPKDYEDMNQVLILELGWAGVGGAPTSDAGTPQQTTFSIIQTHKIVV